MRGACRLDLRLGLKPQLALALGEHGARRDRVDPDAVRPPENPAPAPTSSASSISLKGTGVCADL